MCGKVSLETNGEISAVMGECYDDPPCPAPWLAYATANAIRGPWHFSTRPERELTGPGPGVATAAPLKYNHFQPQELSTMGSPHRRFP